MKRNISKILNQFKFCTLCKGTLKQKENNLLICTSCGFHFYVNPKPTNAAILTNHKGEIMLVKRKVDPKKNYWDLPGGFIDLNETAEESIARELQEELGIMVTTLTYFGSFTDTYFYQNVNFPTLNFIFTGKIDDQITITPHDDILEVQFFTPSNLPYDHIAFESIKEALKRFLCKVNPYNKDQP